MKFANLDQPAAIPRSVISFDDDAGDCTCINPTSVNVPPTEMVRSMREALRQSLAIHRVDSTETETEGARA